MRHATLLMLSLTSLLVAACADYGRFIDDEKRLSQGNKLPCETAGALPAAMFAVEATSPASAGATVSLVPWVFLPAPIMKHDEVLPDSFKATVDETTREIVLTGQVWATRPNPAANCAYADIYAFPKVATLSVPVVLAATGSYTVRIASESFYTPHYWELQSPNEPGKVYPEPTATRSLIIE
ncbi:MAG TPA: hypothetical protein V6D05_10075 [Stenomitos sp.]